MSISTELNRIQTDRNTIRTKLVELGMATSSDTLDKLATAIEALVNQGAVQIEVKEGESYTIPKGYHNGAGVVKGVSGGGNYTLQAKTVTPTKKQQAVTSDEGYYGLSGVTVDAIPAAYQDVSSVTAAAGDVLTGKIIVMADGSVATGTMPNNGKVTQTLSVAEVSYTIPKGYHPGTGTVTITLAEKEVTPTKEAQEVTPPAGQVLSKVTVAAIPEKYIDTTTGTAAADQILAGAIAFVKGAKVTGTMKNNGATGGEIDGITTTSVTIPAGYTSGGTVALTSDIEDALAAI